MVQGLVAVGPVPFQLGSGCIPTDSYILPVGKICLAIVGPLWSFAAWLTPARYPSHGGEAFRVTLIDLGHRDRLRLGVKTTFMVMRGITDHEPLRTSPHNVVQILSISSSVGSAGTAT